MRSQIETGEVADNLLLEQFRRGDREALAVLVARHRKPLYGMLVVMSGNGPEADELFQETWFRVLRKINTYRIDNFRAWLLRIGHNLVIDRQRSRRNLVSLDAPASGTDDESGGALLDTLPDDTPGPDKKLINRELNIRMAAAVARLTVEQKEVFLLRVQENMTFREIAVLHGVSINTTLSRMQYAIDKLRKELHDEYHQ